MIRLAAWVPALVLGALACGGASPPPAAPRAVTAIRYEARLEPGDGWVLSVEETIAGGANAVYADSGAGVLSVEVEDARGKRRQVARAGSEAAASARFPIACDGTCRVRYRYDLGRAAEASGDALEVALRAGGDVLAPASTWLLRPEPLTVNIPVELTVATPDGARFATGFRKGASGAYALRSQELSVAGFTAFGAFQTARVPVTGGNVDVAILAGDRRADDATLTRWVRDTATALDTVYARFPVTRAQLFLVPEPGSRHVEMGRTLPAGGASIAVFVGSHAREADLYGDWILAHEMFHLGVPSFWQEGRWLDEGLATYYEPVLRARAGLLAEDEVWREFTAGMKRGLAGPGDGPLVDTSDHDRIYWGGALFVLRADVEIRRRSKGARSLDDGLRAVVARGGEATRIWSVDYFLKVIDEAVGAPVMTEMLAQASSPASEAQAQADFTALWRDLGVDRSPLGAISLRGDAPLAAVRQRIAELAPPRSAVAARRGAASAVRAPAR